MGAPEAGGAFESYSFKELGGHKRQVTWLAWNRSGRKLASASRDRTICIWHVAPSGQAKADKPQVTLHGHSGHLQAVVWDPSHEEHVASAADDRTVRLWDARSAKPGQEIACASVPEWLDWNVARPELAVLDDAGLLTFSDVRKSGKPLSSRKTDCESHPGQIAFSRNGLLFFQCVGNGVEVYSYPALESVATLEGHTAPALSLALDQSGRWLVSGGMDGVVAAWDLDAAACLRTFTALDQPVVAVSVSGDARHVAYGGQQEMVPIDAFEPGAKPHLLQLPGRQPGTECLAWNPVHPVLALTGVEVRAASRSADAGTLLIYAPFAS
ncbi:hypothetical protein WJX81_004712 [Elliptochloris bilobata]|uniref:Uncharacterized protein n=1 Tax=Elliptochloris bilobata TaxID=381761 RepID=A0AAW1QDV3_9CHLO